MQISDFVLALSLIMESNWPLVRVQLLHLFFVSKKTPPRTRGHAGLEPAHEDDVANDFVGGEDPGISRTMRRPQ
jgi:hypothetical protein